MSNSTQPLVCACCILNIVYPSLPKRAILATDIPAMLSEVSEHVIRASKHVIRASKHVTFGVRQTKATILDTISGI